MGASRNWRFAQHWETDGDGSRAKCCWKRPATEHGPDFVSLTAKQLRPLRRSVDCSRIVCRISKIAMVPNFAALCLRSSHNLRDFLSIEADLEITFAGLAMQYQEKGDISIRHGWIISPETRAHWRAVCRHSPRTDLPARSVRRSASCERKACP
jgi:hypothetical protein